jgi:hypothetical protein
LAVPNQTSSFARGYWLPLAGVVAARSLAQRNGARSVQRKANQYDCDSCEKKRGERNNADLRAHILGLRSPDQTDTTEANRIHLSRIHIGLVTVEADEISRNPGIGDRFHGRKTGRVSSRAGESKKM